jgi:arylsulfatase A-like enzyme
VLKDYGYATAAWGKWHNTPAEETTSAGPFENWPTNLGFEDSYGFLGGEASQYQPNLVRNTTYVQTPKTVEEGYHLSEDLADDAIGWLHKHKAFQPDKPFFMYWASGAIHGPHQVAKEWADNADDRRRFSYLDRPPRLPRGSGRPGLARDAPLGDCRVSVVNRVDADLLLGLLSRSSAAAAVPKRSARPRYFDSGAHDLHAPNFHFRLCVYRAEA